MANTGNSVSAIAGFNWQVYAELHNKILDIGRAALEETGWTQRPESWWETYFPSDDQRTEDLNGEDARDPAIGAELERRLPQSVINFLKTARHDYAGSDEPEGKNFFYCIQGLSTPEIMLADLNTDEWRLLNGNVVERDALVRLYWTNMRTCN